MWHVESGHNVWAGFGVLHLVVSEPGCNNSAVDRVQKAFQKILLNLGPRRVFWKRFWKVLFKDILQDIHVLRFNLKMV